MTTRYLNLTSREGVVSLRFPDRDWMDNPAVRIKELDAQMGDLYALGESLRRVLNGRRNRVLDLVVTLHDDDGQKVPLHIDYGYDVHTLKVRAVRFVRDPDDRDDDGVVVEYDFATRNIHVGQGRCG